jgi:hypothetical protein
VKEYVAFEKTIKSIKQAHRNYSDTLLTLLKDAELKENESRKMLDDKQNNENDKQQQKEIIILDDDVEPYDKGAERQLMLDNKPYFKDTTSLQAIQGVFDKKPQSLVSAHDRRRALLDSKRKKHYQMRVAMYNETVTTVTTTVTTVTVKNLAYVEKLGITL